MWADLDEGVAMAFQVPVISTSQLLVIIMVCLLLNYLLGSVLSVDEQLLTCGSGQGCHWDKN